MSLLDREFVGDFFKTFGVLLFLISILFFVSTLLDEFAAIFGSTDNGLYWGVLYFLTRLPKNLVETSAILVAAAILWVITKKARQNEILAWAAAGISPARIAAPLMACAGLLGLAVFALNEFVVPGAEDRAFFIRTVYFKQKDASVVTSNRNIYQKGAKNRFYIIQRYDRATATMVSPLIVDAYPARHTPEWMLRAERAFLTGDGPGAPWKFVNATLRRLDVDGQVTSYERYPEILDSELDRPMEPNLRNFLSNLDDPANMGFFGMRNYIKLLDAQGKQVAELKVRMHNKLSTAAGMMVIALLICGHIIRPNPRNAILGLGGGLAWVLAYYGATYAGNTMGGTLMLPPVLAAWSTNIAAAVAGAWLLSRGGR